jgi:hypothetical protein
LIVLDGYKLKYVQILIKLNLLDAWNFGWKIAWFMICG